MLNQNINNNANNNSSISDASNTCNNASNAKSTKASTKTPKLIIRYLGLCEYAGTFNAMQEFTKNRDADTTDEFWILEHHRVFTQGQAGKSEHIICKSNIPIIQTDRGGQVTYHGPGQLVCYLLVDLKRNNFGIRKLVSGIEQAIIDFLAQYNILGHRIENAPGIYVNNEKICSLGLRIKKGCSYHGLAFNINMDTTPFSYINPCGFKGLQITQLKNEGGPQSVSEAATSLIPFLAKHLEYDMDIAEHKHMPTTNHTTSNPENHNNDKNTMQNSNKALEENLV